VLYRLLFTFWNFAMALIRHKFGLKGNEQLYYSGQSFHKSTYRYPDKSLRDPVIALRIYKRIFSSLFKEGKAAVYYKNKSGHAIFDGNMLGVDLRYNYVEKYTGIKNELFISKVDLVCYTGLAATILTVGGLLVTVVPVFLLSLVSKNKLHYPMVVSECLECFYLQNVIKRNAIKTLHYFCIYELDANICAYILMKQSVFVNKIPSEVPLYFFNQIVIADQLSFCFAYQQEEYEAFKETMFVKKTTLWGPEQILTAPVRFLEEREEKKTIYDIGFFSSGNWIRERMGDVNLGHKERENEELLLSTLIDYATKYNLSLRIFLHPNEKSAENEMISDEYYSRILHANKNISVADKGRPSIEGFDEINIGIALYSTLMFERIFLGLKTILVPWGYPEFPLPGSGFKNICAASTSELEACLKINLNRTTDEFFILNNIDAYRSASLITH
jgi:hypothetical protein